MYHCHIHFYLTGHPCRVFELIKEISPMENFTYEFSQNENLEGEFIANANVIFANLQDMDLKKALRALYSSKHDGTELILLAEKGQLVELGESLDGIKDVWVMPMEDAEIRFRILRWQQAYKLSKDFWQADHFLTAAIDNTPNLIWYKDKNGIHEKVNISFCKTVNKTREQVQGRGHAYIWDVEEDDPVCIESERKVMENKRTYVSDEMIKTGEGDRLLETYKSPLCYYDISPILL